MEEKDIEREIVAYGQAAAYVKESGLDGVDLLASHGELLTEFLSPVLNKRKDQYGGSLEGRLKLIMQVIQRVREYVSNDIALGMRIPGEEKFQGGNTPSDTAEIARRLDGKLDWISTDLGFSPQDDDWQAVPMYVESG
jgi:2,4-dienoyl-CoA reductase (NADPH2)